MTKTLGNYNIQYPPQSWQLEATEFETRVVLLEQISRQCFSKYVYNLILGWYMNNAYTFVGDEFSDIIVIDLHTLHTSLYNKVMYHKEGRLTITHNHKRPWKIHTQFPLQLSCSVGEHHVLHLGRGP